MTERPLRVLLLEDSADDAELVLRQLRRDGYAPTSTRVDTEAALVKALESEYDLVLSDYRLPTFDGMRALTIVRSLRPHLPFIIISGTIGEDLAVAVMRAGASDYLLKDRLARLGHAVERALEQARGRSERAAFVEAIQDAEAQFRSIFDNALEGLFVTTVEGRLLAANPALARIFGYETPAAMLAEVSNFPADCLVAGDTGAARFETAMANAGRVTGLPALALRRDGAQIAIVLTVYEVVDARGRRHRNGLLADVTGHRRAEAALAESQEQLRQSQKMEAVGLLAGGIAHDFNNLLAVIIGSADLAMQDLRLDRRAHDAFEDIERAGRRAAALTSQLLAFSRRQVAQPRLLRLNDVVGGMESLLRRLIGEDIDLRVEPTSRVGTVLADQGQLEQVILNLAVNARDAMPTGGRLTIRTDSRALDPATAARLTAKAGQYAVLTVADTGIGMDEDTRARVFEPFFTTKPSGRGTGLGLSTVYGIVKQSGGWLDLVSAPGAGTTFTIGLPRQDKEAAADAAAQRPHEGRRPGVRVLVVEDEAPVRMLLTRMLQACRHDVVAVGSGEEALTLVGRGEHFDLLIADAVMPGISGPALVERLLSQVPDLKVLYCSGYAPEKLLPQGPTPSLHFLAKPFTLAELSASVEQALDSQPPAA